MNYFYYFWLIMDNQNIDFAPYQNLIGKYKPIEVII